MKQAWAGSGWKLPALSGGLLGLSYYAPLLIPGFVSFLPLLYWLDANPRAGRYSRLKGGLIFGLVAHAITLHFHYAMLRFTWLAVLLYVLFALALALRIGISVALMSWLRRRTGLSWGVLLPVCWLPFEWLQTFGDLRMPGDHLANTLAGYPFLIQFADLLGHYGVGAFLLCVNGLAYEALLLSRRPAGRRALVALIAIVAPVLAYDLWAWNRSEPPDAPTLRVGLVQPNIEQMVKMSPDTGPVQWESLAALTREAAARGAELIVWPESARPYAVFHWQDRPRTYAMPDVQSLAREVGVPLLVGTEYAQVRGESDYDLYNATLLAHADGSLDPVWAAKAYLVPFTEALPFKGLFGRVMKSRKGGWRWLTGGFTPGPTNVIFDVAGARVGVLNCFEQYFAGLARGLSASGAEVQFVLTNDAWYGRSVFQRYQADVVRLRAIENRTTFVRVANTGISGFVDPRGRYHQRTALFEAAVAVRDVPRSPGLTAYQRLGDIVVALALACLGWASLLAWRLGKDPDDAELAPLF